MRKTLQRLESEQRKGTTHIGGDDDVEYRDPAEVARRAQDRASAKMKRQQGGETVNLSQDMIAELIAAGADIEIL